MKDIGINEQTKLTFSELLERNCYYKVPIFQRQYSWSKDEWSDLYEDLEKAIINNSQHFFGFIMLKPESDKYVSIIEGQQRLSTVTIIICVIRDILFELNNDLCNKFDSKFVKTINIFDSEAPPDYKVSLSKINNTFFRENILVIDKPLEKIKKGRNVSKIHDSNKLIINCYDYFYKIFNSNIKQLREQDQAKKLVKYLETLLMNFIVISTEVTSNKIAYNIFQTLNDRGLDLALADLLKVHLFELAGDDVEKANDRWEDFTNTLGNINLNLFLRHYWLSKNGIVGQKYLMDEFEKKISSKAQVFKFLNELKLEAEFYESLYNKSEDIWNKEIVELIDELFILSKNMVLPLLLASLPKLKDSIHAKFLSNLISFIFRYITIAEKENKEIESSFSKLAIDIRENKITTLRQIKERFLKNYVYDDEFQAIFAKKDIKTTKFAKYILQKIEVSLDPLKEKFSDKITLEHILPQNPDDDWKNYLVKNSMEKDELVYKIGNLTLLLGRPNKVAQNKIFTYKSQKVYSKMTKLKLNQPLANLQSWNEKDILLRQKMLSNYASSIWKIDSN